MLAALGADDRNRTCMTWVEAMRLCHSATPAQWDLLESNQRPPGIQPGALATLS